METDDGRNWNGSKLETGWPLRDGSQRCAHWTFRFSFYSQQMADPSIDWLHQLSTQRIVNDNELISRVPPVGLFQLNGSLISYLLKDSWQVNARYRARHGRSRGGPAWPNLTLLNINGISPLRMIRIFGLKIDQKWNAMNEVNLSVGDHFNRKKTNPAVSRSDVWNSVRYPPHFYSRDY